MKRLAAPLFAVIFTLLSGGYANGGDWHSAGNAPEPIYIPKMPVSYTCKISATLRKNGRYISADQTVSFTSNDFAADGTVRYSISGEKPEILNGQRFKLDFKPNQDGTENARLTIFTNIPSARSPVSVSNGSTALRSDGVISASGGTVSVGSRTLNVRADCKAN